MTQRRSLAGVASDLWGTPSVEKAAAETTPVPETFDFASLWQRADDVVDWTEALVHASPVDAITDKARWELYHRYAAQVLAGDTAAYAQVLQVCNPLSEMTAWTDGAAVTVEDADHLTVRLSVRQRDRLHLAGLSLRAARDLFALLPVSRVTATVVQGEETLLSVTFEKEELHKVRFAFVEPTAFVEQCGGEFFVK